MKDLSSLQKNDRIAFAACGAFCYTRCDFMYRYAQGRQNRRGAPFFHKVFRAMRTLDRGALVRNLVLLGIAGVLLGFLCLLGLFAWYSRDLPDPHVLIDRTVAQATKIYDRTGEHVLYEIYGEENRTVVQMQQGFCGDDVDFVTSQDGIPLFVAQAVVAAEDRAFCTHHGFSVTGILRAVIFQGDRGGGSTLTQQLVKNALLTSEKHLSRKIKELILSVALERRYSKDEILQIYFNEIGYGSVYYGIQSAAENFYGKAVKDLTLAEGATLAAIPQRPTTLINNPELLRERRDWILTSMAELGYITEEAATAAQQEETPVHLRSNGALVAPHFVMWVKGMLEERFGTSAVETGGLRVITTLDYEKQLAAEEAVVAGVAQYGAAYDFTSAGLLAQNPRTGEIVAMVGSPDFTDDAIDGQVNVTLQRIQPGSSIKPMVYAAAFEKGFTPNTVLWDAVTTFVTETAPYTPLNYDGKEHGLISLRAALQGSLNIPAVKTLALVGIDNAVSFLQRLGYTTLTDRSRLGLSLVLGGAEVTMLDHVGAYSVFANEGVHHDVQALLRVEDALGNELFSFDPDSISGEQVLDKNIAAMISDVLSDNTARAYVFGPVNHLILSDRPVAAKTGTTNNYKDAWTVGYTPSLVAGVWVGNASGALMKTGADGSKIAAPVWQTFMTKALAGTPAEAFPVPEIPVTGKSILDGSLAATPVTIDRASGKLATERTPASYRQTLSCGEFHTILKYIDPENPLGEAPENPEDHPQYAAWESGILQYIATYNANLLPDQIPLATCTPPTEYDDVHTAENTPEIRVLSPERNDKVERTFSVRYEGEVRLSFGRVEFALDDVYLGTSSSLDFGTVTLPSWVGVGKHTLAVSLYDAVDNVATDEVTIVVEEEGSSQVITLTNPFDGQTIVASSDLATYALVVEIPSATELATLTISAQALATGEVVDVGAFVTPTAILTVPWTLPAPGVYVLRAQGITSDGVQVDAKSVTVFVQ